MFLPVPGANAYREYPGTMFIWVNFWGDALVCKVLEVHSDAPWLLTVELWHDPILQTKLWKGQILKVVHRRVPAGDPAGWWEPESNRYRMPIDPVRVKEIWKDHVRQMQQKALEKARTHG